MSNLGYLNGFILYSTHTHTVLAFYDNRKDAEEHLSVCEHKETITIVSVTMSTLLRLLEKHIDESMLYLGIPYCIK